MLDLACYDHMSALLADIQAVAHERRVWLEVRPTFDGADGNLVYGKFDTIVIHPRMCGYKPAFVRWVMAHELGHAAAGYMSTEEAADSYARKWYGNTDALLAILQDGCASGSEYYCNIYKRWK